MAGNSKFKDAFKKHSAKAWENAKTAEASDFRLTLPAGTYRGLEQFDLDVIAKGEKKGTPLVKQTITVAEGDYEGNASANKGFMLGGDYLDTNMEKLVKVLKKTFPDEADDIAALDEDGIVEYLMNIDGHQFPVEFDVVETTMKDKDPKTGKETGKEKDVKYFTVNGPLAGEEGGEESSSEEASEPAGKADDWFPAKGDSVLYTPDGEDDSVECEVKTANKAKQTVTIQANESGETYRNISVSELEPAAE